MLKGKEVGQLLLVPSLSFFDLGVKKVFLALNGAMRATSNLEKKKKLIDFSVEATKMTPRLQLSKAASYRFT